jgi:hypothetical protein
MTVAEELKAEIEILKSELDMLERRIETGYYQSTYELNKAIVRVDELKLLLGRE